MKSKQHEDPAWTALLGIAVGLPVVTVPSTKPAQQTGIRAHGPEAGLYRFRHAADVAPRTRAS